MQPVSDTEILKKYNKFVILISSPDGDSIGSSIVLKQYLEDQGKIADIYSGKKINKRYSFLPNTEQVNATDTTKINYFEYEVIIAMDAGNLSQLYDMDKHPNFIFPENIEMLAIDHHESNPMYAKYNIYDKEASSTSEIIYTQILQGYKLTDSQAQLLFFGIVSDTGFFRWSTSSKTLKAASELATYNIEYDKLSSIYTSDINEKDADVFQELIKRTKYHKRPRFVYLYVSKRIMAKLKIREDELQNYINIYRSHFQISLSDYPIYLIITEKKDFYIISMRGNSYTNTANFAKFAGHSDFNGGGHKNAASYSSRKKIKDIVKDISLLIKQFQDTTK
jgi:phosphoesterase RecJ-like protein